MNKIFVLILLLSLQSFSQNSFYEIEYVCVRTLNFKVLTNDILYYDVDKKISYYKEGNYIKLEEPKLPSENVVIISDNNTNNKNYIYTLFQENIIYDYTSPFEQYYTYSENLPEINWKITNETKNTEGIELTKATASFRGRNYEVWFSYEYPIPIGPWKFQGLPGLIFEVIDLSEPFNYHWQLKKISNKKRVIPFTGKNLKNVLTIQEFLRNFKEEHMGYSDVVMSRSNIEYVPASVEEREESFRNYRQLKREIKYEWER